MSEPAEAPLPVYPTGVHCESAAAATLLLRQGLAMDEALLFGLGGGLDFWVLSDAQATQTYGPFGFVSGRIWPGKLTGNMAAALGLNFQTYTHAAGAEALENLTALLAENSAGVGVQLNCGALPYFKSKQYFPAHYAVVLEIDTKCQAVTLAETQQQGPLQRVPLKAFEAAWATRPGTHIAQPFLCYTLSVPANYKAPSPGKLQTLGLAAHAAVAERYVNEGCAKNIETFAQALKNYAGETESLKTLGKRMELAGTGGACFRNLYQSFLSSFFNMPQGASKFPQQNDIHNFKAIAGLWGAAAGACMQGKGAQAAEFLTRAASAEQQFFSAG